MPPAPPSPFGFASSFFSGRLQNIWTTPFIWNQTCLFVYSSHLPHFGRSSVKSSTFLRKLWNRQYHRAPPPPSPRWACLLTYCISKYFLQTVLSPSHPLSLRPPRFSPSHPPPPRSRQMPTYMHPGGSQNFRAAGGHGGPRVQWFRNRSEGVWVWTNEHKTKKNSFFFSRTNGHQRTTIRQRLA